MIIFSLAQSELCTDKRTGTEPQGRCVTYCTADPCVCVRVCEQEAADARLFRLTADDTDSERGCGRVLHPEFLDESCVQDTSQFSKASAVTCFVAICRW